MEAEKSHSLPSESCRPRKASGIVLVQVQKAYRQGADGVHPSSSVGEDGCPCSSCRVESQFFLCLFIPFRPSRDWARLTLERASVLV